MKQINIITYLQRPKVWWDNMLFYLTATIVVFGTAYATTRQAMPDYKEGNKVEWQRSKKKQKEEEMTEQEKADHEEMLQYRAEQLPNIIENKNPVYERFQREYLEAAY